MHPPFVPAKYRPFLLEYITLAKTRLADFKVSEGALSCPFPKGRFPQSAQFCLEAAPPPQVWLVEEPFLQAGRGPLRMLVSAGAECWRDLGMELASHEASPCSSPAVLLFPGFNRRHGPL